MLEVLLGICIIAPGEVHHRGCSQLVSGVGVHAGHMKCRDVARKALTVFFTGHHVQVADLDILGVQRVKWDVGFVLGLALATSRVNWSCVEQ